MTILDLIISSSDPNHNWHHHFQMTEKHLRRLLIVSMMVRHLFVVPSNPMSAVHQVILNDKREITENTTGFFAVLPYRVCLSEDLQVVIWDIMSHFHPFLDQLIGHYSSLWGIMPDYHIECPVRYHLFYL